MWWLRNCYVYLLDVFVWKRRSYFAWKKLYRNTRTAARILQVYDGLSYKLVLEFPSGYPYKAPTVKFETPCYHPNVDGSGNICLDILKEKWSALYDVRTILLSVQSLLAGDCLTVFGWNCWNIVPCWIAAVFINITAATRIQFCI